MSIFEMAIQLRDDLVRGDQELVGGRDLGLLDMALDNVLRHTAAIGAKQNRVEELQKRAEFRKEQRAVNAFADRGYRCRGTR